MYEADDKNNDYFFLFKNHPKTPKVSRLPQHDAIQKIQEICRSSKTIWIRDSEHLKLPAVMVNC